MAQPEGHLFHKRILLAIFAFCRELNFQAEPQPRHRHAQKPAPLEQTAPKKVINKH